MTIQIAHHLIGPDQPPFIIAEMSGNHNQSLDRALKRQHTIENRFESLGINYHQKILNGFDTLQKKNPNRIIRINADNRKEIISSQISAFTKKLLNKDD